MQFVTLNKSPSSIFFYIQSRRRKKTQVLDNNEGIGPCIFFQPLAGTNVLGIVHRVTCLIICQ